MHNPDKPFSPINAVAINSYFSEVCLCTKLGSSAVQLQRLHNKPVNQGII